MEIIRILFDYGVKAYNDSALFIASSMGNFETVKLLLDKGARVYNSLEIAIEKGYIEIVRLLLNPKYGSKIEDSFLLLAIMNGHVEIAQLLVEKGLVINNDNYSLTLIKGLVIKADRNCPIFIGKGVKADYRNSEALFKASYAGYVEIVKLLLGAKCRPDTITVRLACSIGDMEMLRLLLKEHEVDDIVNSKDLLLAIMCKRTDFIKLLLPYFIEDITEILKLCDTPSLCRY